MRAVRAVFGVLGIVVACGPVTQDLGENFSSGLGRMEDAGAFAQDARAVPDAGTASDVATGSDGSTPPADAEAAGRELRPACGSGFCRVDETCEAGMCVMPCTGLSVPGDYPTLQSAFDAVSAAGSDATICLKAQAFDEYATMDDKGVHPQRTVTVSGPRAARVKRLWLKGGGKAVLRGLSADELWFDGVSGEITAITAATANVLLGEGDVVIDGADIGAAPAGYGLVVESYGGATPVLTVRNTWIHSAGEDGLCVIPHYGGTQPFKVHVFNSTFSDNARGLHVQSTDVSTYADEIVFSNSLFTRNRTAAVMIEAFTQSHSNNAFWNNGANFVGTVPGNGDVSADPLLDGDAPPAPGMASPLKAAGDSTNAPATDYWGLPRANPPTIGAVE